MSRALSVESLYAQLGLPDAAAVVEVVADDGTERTTRLIPGALRCRARETAQRAETAWRSRQIALYCADGDDLARSSAAALNDKGFAAYFLEGGFDAWIGAGLATVRARPELNAPGGSRWVTRERPKIDRLACPWLVRRFIDPDAMFFYVPAHRVRSDAEALRAVPYDIADVTFSHRGPHCSFDAFLDEFDLQDPALARLAQIVRAADTGDLDAAREASGLLAVSLGLSALTENDLVLMEQAMLVYDALYAWCKKASGETHAWPQKAGRS